MSQQLNTQKADSRLSLIKQIQQKKTKITKTPSERRGAHREASARYCKRHRESLHVAERERAATQRAHLNSLKRTDANLEAACAKAREASARNRQKLAKKQAERRSAAFIKKHGYMTYLKRALM
ncbi:hypothetical protein K438DRAFT_1995092 [Mycena galopus ATCC 62051]|nr:hypothetical protein K438DRAFT_1995092 [Mycena galopus ATCC 62051]